MRRAAHEAGTSEALAVRRKRAAELLGVSESLLLSWERQRRGPRFVRVDRAVLYPVRDLRAWLEANATDPAEAVA